METEISALRSMLHEARRTIEGYEKLMDNQGEEIRELRRLLAAERQKAMDANARAAGRR